MNININQSNFAINSLVLEEKFPISIANEKLVDNKNLSSLLPHFIPLPKTSESALTTRSSSSFNTVSQNTFAKENIINLIKAKNFKELNLLALQNQDKMKSCISYFISNFLRKNNNFSKEESREFFINMMAWIGQPNCQLLCLNFCGFYKKLDKEIIDDFCKALANNKVLHQLDLSNNAIDDNDIDKISRALQYSNVNILNLEHNKIGDAGANSLALLLKANSALTTLYLDANSITHQGAHFIFDSLKTNNKLTELKLTELLLSTQDTSSENSLFNGLTKNTTLCTLNISKNFFTEKNIISLANALKKNTKLTTLVLSGAYLKPASAVALANALTNSSMITLDLSANCIGDEGATSVASLLLNKICALQKIMLDSNDITNTGAFSLFNALEINQTLLELGLSNNRISGEPDLFARLKKNKTLSILNVSFNDIAQTGATALSDAIQDNETLQTLVGTDNWPAGNVWNLNNWHPIKERILKHINNRIAINKSLLMQK